MTTRNSDTLVGVATISVGGGGLTLQAVMEGMSLTLLALNIVLTISGIAWLGYRYKATRRRTRNQRHDDPKEQ